MTMVEPSLITLTRILEMRFSEYEKASSAIASPVFSRTTYATGEGQEGEKQREGVEERSRGKGRRARSRRARSRGKG